MNCMNYVWINLMEVCEIGHSECRPFAMMPRMEYLILDTNSFSVSIRDVHFLSSHKKMDATKWTNHTSCGLCRRNM